MIGKTFRGSLRYHLQIKSDCRSADKSGYVILVPNLNSLPVCNLVLLLCDLYGDLFFCPSNNNRAIPPTDYHLEAGLRTRQRRLREPSFILPTGLSRVSNHLRRARRARPWCGNYQANHQQVFGYRYSTYSKRAHNWYEPQS